MSDYTHRMTLAVPEALMPQANQLALIAGESPDDVNTFAAANWQDADGNLYAVCSTVIKPIVLAMIGKPVADSGLTADGADYTLAQQAMDASVIYSEGDTANPGNIFIAIDVEPTVFFDDLGLIVIEQKLTEVQ